jgi:hypothetical protein
MERFKQQGRCAGCGYVRSGVNHYVLCCRPRPKRRPAESARLLALALYGDVAEVQAERRAVLEREGR